MNRIFNNYDLYHVVEIWWEMGLFFSDICSLGAYSVRLPFFTYADGSVIEFEL